MSLWNNLQVWVLEELELPIVSISSEANRTKVLMKSPWEIIKKPAGSGGIFSLLSSNKILDSLNEMGVEYIQVRSSASHLTVLIIHPDNFGPLSFILTLCYVTWYLPETTLLFDHRYAAHPAGQSLGILCYLVLSLPAVLMLASSSPRPVNWEMIST